MQHCDERTAAPQDRGVAAKTAKLMLDFIVGLLHVFRIIGQTVMIKD